MGAAAGAEEVREAGGEGGEIVISSEVIDDPPVLPSFYLPRRHPIN